MDPRIDASSFCASRASARGQRGKQPPKDRKPIYLLGVILLLLVAGCARPTPSGSPLPSDALVADDFSPPNVGWARFDTEQSAVYVLAGELYLEDRGRDLAVYSPLIGHEHADVQIDVDVRFHPER